MSLLAEAVSAVALKFKFWGDAHLPTTLSFADV
jgi:hypothetical protein